MPDFRRLNFLCSADTCLRDTCFSDKAHLNANTVTPVLLRFSSSVACPTTRGYLLLESYISVSTFFVDSQELWVNERYKTNDFIKKKFHSVIEQSRAFKFRSKAQLI